MAGGFKMFDCPVRKNDSELDCVLSFLAQRRKSLVVYDFAIVWVYALMSRMRVLSSHQVIESAEQLIQQIINTYSAPVKTFAELQGAKYESLDIIRNFSESCRAEFDDLRAQHF